MSKRNAETQAARQLAEVYDSEAQIRAILENAPFELWVRDAEGRCILQSAAAQRHWGDRIGQRIEESGVSDAVAAVWRANNRRAYAGEVVEGEVEYVCDGQPRTYHQVVAPFRVAGEIRGVLGFNIDITKRKRAEEALRASEEKYRSLFESIDEGFCVIEVIFDERGKPVDYRFLEVNPAFQRQTGLVEARGWRIRERVPAHEEHWFTMYGQIVLTGEPVRFESEAAQLGRWYDGFAWRYGRPEDRQVAVLFNDITERKQAEDDRNAAKGALEQRVAERTKSLQMLHDIASMANQAQNAEQAIRYCLQRTAMYNGWCFGHALLPAADDPDILLPGYAWYAEDPQRFRRFREATLALRLQRGQELPGRVFASGQLEWTTNLKQDLSERRAALAEDLGISTAVAFPILLGKKVVAVLEFFSDQVIPHDGRIADAMLDAGLQLGRVIERVEFEEHLLTIAEQIQRRFAQDLHDDLGQELTGLALEMEALADLLESSATPAGDLARTLTVTVERIRRKTRALSHGLLPVELEAGRLAEGLEKLVAATAASSRIRCMFTCAHPDIVRDSRIALHLYRIAQEALTNAVRHSGARQIEVILEEHNREIVLSIHDDGRGMSDAARQSDGMGLRTMRYRAGLIGAKLEVGPGNHGGTEVCCHLPNG